MKRVVLADRDGTLIVEKNYLKSPEQVDLIVGVSESIRRANELGWDVICVSNQSGVGRGFFEISDVLAVNDRVAELVRLGGGKILDFYFSPDPPGIESSHRKPAIGMASDAAEKHGFDLQSTIVVGDKSSDIQLAHNINATSVLVRTGYGAITENSGEVSPDYVVDSFADLPAIIEGLGRNDAGLGASR